jgi:glutathione S-transferase
MKLYYYPVAPNPTKVRLYLAEKAAGGMPLPIEEVLVDLSKGEQNGPEHTARNYFKSVPVLELDDGTFIIESLTAIEYLEELYPTPSLVGRTPIERAQMRQLERIAETRVLNPLARLIHSTRSPLGVPPSPQIAEAAQRMLAKGLDYFNELLADGRSFIAGMQPSIADCTMESALNFGRTGGFELDPSLLHLARWETAYCSRAPIATILSQQIP